MLKAEILMLKIRLPVLKVKKCCAQNSKSTPSPNCAGVLLLFTNKNPKRRKALNYLCFLGTSTAGAILTSAPVFGFFSSGFLFGFSICMVVEFLFSV